MDASTLLVPIFRGLLFSAPGDYRRVFLFPLRCEPERRGVARRERWTLR